MVITKREDVTMQGFCKILLRKLRLWGSLLLILIHFFFRGGRGKGVGRALIWYWVGRRRGGRLWTFSAFRMGDCSRRGTTSRLGAYLNKYGTRKFKGHDSTGSREDVFVVRTTKPVENLWKNGLFWLRYSLVRDKLLRHVHGSWRKQ